MVFNEKNKNIVSIKRTSYMCPSQWEVEIEDGSSIFAYLRNGIFYAYHADTIEEAINEQGNKLYPNSYLLEGLDGFMSPDIFVEILEQAGYNLFADVVEEETDIA